MTTTSTEEGYATDNRSPKHVREVGALFLRLGITAFGGPAAHIAMMRDEVVERRKWIDDQHFLDLIGATNLIPGPNSSEMAIHLGFTRAGLPGLLVGGAAFIFPAFVMVLALAWAYVEFGSTPAAAALLYGIQPVIIPIIVGALIKLGGKALKGVVSAVVGAAVIAVFFLDVALPNIEIDNVILMLAGGLLIALIATLRGENRRDPIEKAEENGKLGLFAPLIGIAAVPVVQTAVTTFSLGLMFLTFLKIGAVLYGSGYTLFAFLQDDFVTRLGWLTEDQLIDAIAIGQMTPGPIVTTATFIGYVLGGFPGAILATLGIFIPSFIAVAITNPIIPKIRESKILGSVLDGVNVAALGLMAAVTIQLAVAAYGVDAAIGQPLGLGLPFDVLRVLVGIAAAVALFRFKVSSLWLVVGGAVFGGIVSLLV